MDYITAKSLVETTMTGPVEPTLSASAASELMYACREVARQAQDSPGYVTPHLRDLALEAIRRFAANATPQAQKLALRAREILESGAGASAGGASGLGLFASKWKGLLLMLVAAAALCGGAYYGYRYFATGGSDKGIRLGPQQYRPRAKKEDVDKVKKRDTGAISSSWHVWYADNIALKPVMVGTKEEYWEVEYCCDYPGGGHARIKMVKVPIAQGTTRQSAIANALRQFQKVKRLSANSTFVYAEWLGWRNGQRHDIDELK